MNNGRLFKKKTQEFLQVWSQFSKRVLDELRDSNFAASINILLVLLDTYVTVVIDTRIQYQCHQALRTAIALDLSDYHTYHTNSHLGYGKSLPVPIHHFLGKDVFNARIMT